MEIHWIFIGQRTVNNMSETATKQNASLQEPEKEKEPKKETVSSETNSAKETGISQKTETEEKASDKKTKKKKEEPSDWEEEFLDNAEKEEEKNEEDLLDDTRVSIALTPENAEFFPSEGGLVSMRLCHENGEVETFERVIVLRAFPVTNPNEFLSIREPDPKRMGKAKEIGMIRRASDFDEKTNVLFNQELDRRYFTPEILKIENVKEKFGYFYWTVQTSAGHITFIFNNPFNSIRVMEDGRVMFNDIDGNSFVIKDPKKLDPASYKKIEIYL